MTVDGNIDICFTEDTAKKFSAQEWHVINVGDDATNDVSSVFKALKEAKENSYRNPILVNILTTIGYGSRNQGLHPTHGTALGD